VTSRHYDIRVKGHLDADRWTQWFDGLHVAPQTDGTTVLSGLVTDQAALHGLLGKVRDLGLVLVFVQRGEYNSGPERKKE